MKLQYHNISIPTTQTYNKQIMRYKFQKIYYAIIIYDCNRYSSIASKQRVDIVMTDENLNILSYLKEMHENTVYEDKKAKITILLPLNSIEKIEIGTKFEIIN